MTDVVINKVGTMDRNKIGEGIYLLYFALMIGARTAGLYEGQKLYTILLALGLALFVLKMIVTRHDVKEYVVAAGFLFVAGMVYLHTGEKGLLVCFTMMLGMKAVSVRKVISVGALVAGCIILAKIFLGVFGFTSEIYYPQERFGLGVMFRHALGYAHPNTLHMNVLMLSMMVIYLVSDYYLSIRTNGEVIKRDDFTIVSIASLVVFGFNFYIFQYSASRTGLLGCIVYLVFNLWFFFRKKIGWFEKVILYATFPVVCFIAIPFPFLISGDLYEFLDSSVFSRRLFLADYFWQNNGVTIWGNRLSNPYPLFFTYGIDMAQLYLLLQLGLVAFIVIALLTIWFVYEGIKHDRRAELAVFVAMMFLGIWEPFLYNLGFKNFLFVFWGAMIYAVLNEDMSCFGVSGDGKQELAGKVSLKYILLTLLVAVAVGGIFSGVYYSVSKKPTALYGDRQENESGVSFDMEPLFLTQEEVDVHKASGDIMIGYVDEKTPMYMYDSSIAMEEYMKKVMSVGVWSGIFVVLISTLFCVFFRRRVSDI